MGEVADWSCALAGLRQVALTNEWDGISVADRRNLEREAVLDPEQAEALTAAMKQNLTIIQGPPGTGRLTACHVLFTCDVSTFKLSRSA